MVGAVFQPHLMRQFSGFSNMRNALSPQRGDMFIEKVLLPTLSPQRGDMLIASFFTYRTYGAKETTIRFSINI